MPFVIEFPAFLRPEIFTLDLGSFQFSLRWYALAYIAGFLIGWRLIVAAMRRPALWPDDRAPMTAPQVESLLTWIILGVILGGRLGFVLVYQPEYYLSHPAQILQVWEGGMSFHGGLAGATLAGFLYARRHGIPPSAIGDSMAMVIPVGLGLGRISNFINAELWGHPTTLPWGVMFPGTGSVCPPDWMVLCARHPTQLYEAGLEGLLLGLVMWLIVTRFGALKRPWLVTGLFLTIYGLSRILVEVWRMPDDQFLAEDPAGYVIRLGDFGLTMGQTLSLPMVAIGLALILWSRRRA
ncbi:prolipoprotein diacylglyceryl transferase [Pararhodobacter aggregans]|uniref:Phosphatidylglycerol--prolipoprotein diacylglyceryl transferase n=1 Tax=Pararhodobacter aggregans TaxID=404875 RepID=A0A2T7UJY6_9RHOB|nr:prolipoprotein diacylglyceryl transferase [Pararhodobacter aggregans]PTW98907.1 prolipoprotein diacylglyceryl transferase [Pararhodobacter aggregans]PVE45002.1 prolipoprotein diacylglyceryl transferase [Pararhodobacter aggregans]